MIKNTINRSNRNKCIWNEQKAIMQKRKSSMQQCNFGYIAKENIRRHKLNWQQAPDHPYRVLTIGGSESGITTESNKLRSRY